MTIQTIALNQLVPSAANVRKTGVSAGIDELAASIEAHGLLQNLQVRPAAKGEFEVVAGGRRLAALKLLAKQKKLAKDFEVPCHMLDGEDADEVSLAENIMRLAMHPADQFDAFRAMIEQGKGVEDVAARFGTAPAIVRQRLKLACVSPNLIDLYRHDEMSLDQLMAFTISDDHAAQEAAWFGQPEWQRKPDAIRRALTSAHVEADNQRVRFVGLTLYKESGGGIIRDLFQPDHEGYLTDPALLDRLVAERLEAEATAIRAEGWKWVETMPHLDYALLHSFDRVHPERVPLPAEQQDELDRLTEEYDALADEGSEDFSPEIETQLDALSARIDALSVDATAWRAEDKEIAGAIVAIGHDGGLEITRGLVRREDAKALRVIAENGDEESEQPTPGLSAALIEDLTAHRTAALRATMIDNERVALAALAHALALPLFYPHSLGAKSCLDLHLYSRDLRPSAEGVAESGAETLLDARMTAWEGQLPEDAADLFEWLLDQSAATITRLLAFCAAQGVNAVRGKQDRADCQRLIHADRLADALNLDMTLWWKANRASYFSRVPKALILDAITEAVSANLAAKLSGLKKDTLILRAEEKLTGKDWLPAILRKPRHDAAEEALQLAAE